MSVRQRMEELEEEMDALFQRKLEIRTLRDGSRKTVIRRRRIRPTCRLNSARFSITSRLSVSSSSSAITSVIASSTLGSASNSRAHRADPGHHPHLDVIGGGSDEDNQAYLKYYASDEERARWKADFPDEQLPPRKQPQYKRELASQRDPRED